MIKIDVRDVQKKIENVKKRGLRIRPVLTEIGYIMEEAIETNFDVGGRPKWEPLKAVTLKMRANRGTSPGRPFKGSMHRSLIGGNSPLILTGRLKNSIKVKVTSKRVIMGTNVPYAKLHQKGGTRTLNGRLVRIPARPFLVIPPEDKKKMTIILKEYILRGK
jgi:phage virion morphogenesis protein